MSERRHPSVKFCGLTRADDAAAAGRLGARYLGAIFAGGPRLIAAPNAASVFSAGRAAAVLQRQAMPKCVGVMGTQSPDEIASIADEASLDIIQLHADPTPADVARVRAATRRDVWAALRIAGTEVPDIAAELFAVADAVVLDARVPGQLGGTGVALDWRALGTAIARVRSAGTLVLAGGLTPANVRAAADAMQPDIVDVSSGVESAPGQKDHQLMRAFVLHTRDDARYADGAA